MDTILRDVRYAVRGLLRSRALTSVSTDPVTLSGVTALLVVVGVGVSLAPARRAMRLDPVVALRHDSQETL